MLAGASSQLSGLAFAAVVLATSAVLVAGLAWASRRLLGLPVGALRALTAGLLGFIAAYLLGRSLRAAQPGHVAVFVTVVLGVPLIVAMLFIVLAEVLVPSGTLPQPVEMVRGTRSALRRSRRYAQISRIAVRHGLGPCMRGWPAAATARGSPPRPRSARRSPPGSPPARHHQAWRRCHRPGSARCPTMP
jgi:ubiquinone biosynthesis protein